MKKKWKIVVTVIVAVVLSVALYFTYIFKFKQYDVADDEVAEIVSNPYKIELPDGTFVTIDDLEGEENDEEKNSELGENGTEIDAEVGTGTKNENEEDENGTGTVASGKSNTGKVAGTTTNQEGAKGGKEKVETVKKPAMEKPTVASVKAKYIPAFENLESQANTKINALVVRAKKEYSAKKANGESISYGYFYNKYMGAATELENTTDKVFYGVVKALENDLVKNGFNKSYAQTFIDEYEAMKKTRRDNLLKKAIGS